MFKVIMHLTTVDSIATTQTLQDNLQNLTVFAATVSGNIDKINTSCSTPTSTCPANTSNPT
jgi:hypothetical protein